MSALKHVIFFLAATMLLFACKKEEQKEEPKEHYGTTNGRTVLAYIVSDNNMSAQAQIDIREMLIGAKYLGDKDHLMIYLDDSTFPRIYDVTNSNAGQAYKDLTPVYAFDKEVNSCSYDQFLWVLNYMKEAEQPSLHGFLDEVALYTDLDKADGSTDCVLKVVRSVLIKRTEKVSQVIRWTLRRLLEL